jgi:hypothetical protein
MSKWSSEKKVMDKGVSTINYYDIYYNQQQLALYKLGQSEDSSNQQQILYIIPVILGIVTGLLLNNLFYGFVVLGLTSFIIYELSSKRESNKMQSVDVDDLISSGKAEVYDLNDIDIKHGASKTTITTPNDKLKIKKKIGKKLEYEL